MELFLVRKKWDDIFPSSLSYPICEKFEPISCWWFSCASCGEPTQLRTLRGCGFWEVLAVLLQEHSHNRVKDEDLLGFSGLGLMCCWWLAQCSSMGAAWDYFSFSCFLSLVPRVFHAYLHVFECSHSSSKGTLAACCVVFRAVFRDFLWCPFWWRMGKLPVQIPPSEMWGERVRTLRLSSS